MNFDLGAALRKTVNAFVDWLLASNADGMEAFGRAAAAPVLWLERALVATPAALIIAAIALLAWRLGRSWRFALAMAALLGLIAALGVWAEAMRSLALIVVSVGLAFAIGLPLGVLGARHAAVGTVTRPVYDLMQTIPSFVYLIPAAMLFGLGAAPALMATTIAAVPPIGRLTDLGLREVPRAQTDAARALGLGSGRTLLLVELPLAWPTVMAGVNQSVMAALGMVVVASMIGAKGLGEIVLLGLQRADAGAGALGGIAIVALAVVIDRITQAAGRPRWRD